MKRYGKSMVLFRRDLRLHDNNALALAADLSAEIVPAFCRDPRQADPAQNAYYGANACAFLQESLVDLDAQLQEHGSALQLFHGTVTEVLRSVFPKSGVEALFVSADYTPFARRRDASLKALCDLSGVSFHVVHDALLWAPGSVLSGTGTPYKVFSAFYRMAQKTAVAKPKPLSGCAFTPAAEKMAGATNVSSFPVPTNQSPERITFGGRSEGLKYLAAIPQKTEYAEKRDLPAVAVTTMLSPYHKFGCVSIRESYHAGLKAFGPAHTFLSELAWRDFFSHVAWHFPHVFQGAFRPEYDAIPWGTDDLVLARWKTGRTGVPMVDAGMRELNATGNMHNRVRMVVASYLVKNLHQSWRSGEQYFAQKLTDYDPAVNNGNWQWAASTGCDAQPYFRVFNPYTQAKKFDSDATYIKRWIPELQDVPAKDICAWEDKAKRYPDLAYPRTTIDRKATVAQVKEMFQTAKLIAKQ